MSKEQRKGNKYPYESKASSSAYKSRTDPPEYCAFVFFDGREPENVFVEDGIEYERIDKIPFDWDAVPEHVKNELAKSALEAFLRFMKRPDAREILDATKNRLRREGSTLLDR